jgi:hypothetical protein
MSNFKILKFPELFEFPPAKRVLFARSSKSPEFYALKNVKKKKAYSFFFEEKKSDSASQHRRPQKNRKSRF